MRGLGHDSGKSLNLLYMVDNALEIQYSTHSTSYLVPW